MNTKDSRDFGIPEYPSNSSKAKAAKEKAVEKKEIKKVVNGSATIKKKSGLRKFADGFVSEDAGTVKSYIFSEVILPGLKDLIVDMVTDGINLLVNGESSRRKKSNRGGVSYVSYEGNTKKRDRDRGRESSERRHAYSYDEIVLETRADAEEVLNQMDELIETYDAVSVGDLYDLVGVSGSYTDNKYGWTNLRNADVVRVRGGGYALKLPKALPLD